MLMQQSDAYVFLYCCQRGYMIVVLAHIDESKSILDTNVVSRSSLKGSHSLLKMKSRVYKRLLLLVDNQ